MKIHQICHSKRYNFVQVVRIKLGRLQVFGLLYHNRFRKKMPKIVAAYKVVNHAPGFFPG